MPRQAGYYEWDDADLRPGSKKEGGWHQTLFDADGKLKGNARFVPSDEAEFEPTVVYETVYVTSDTRREEFFDDEMKEAIAEALTALLMQGASRIAPHAKAWFGKRVRAMRHSAKWGRGKQVEQSQVGQGDEVADEVLSSALVESDQPVPRPKMSSSEAQARMIAATAAQAFAEEQMRMVTGAEIVDASDIDEVRMQLASIPKQELEDLIALLGRRPELLSDDNLANLAAPLQRQHRELEPAPKRRESQK